ncbi:3-oxoacyl-ACP reductase FabG [Zavarzinia aquatilis]|uniref:3-oxoacyl-ACP reductase FabG n=1 Tax=Zavarzinia aquatilis TaxID=2211142 RepID=A0A317ECB3_9PROT|nr:3-oxoacyl-ACP reductase FabG [Zavarzinia aquatilis]PWR22845.1 3-oxoacyl-ACP reductase FabG [Zavarzinia aquatilis]
MFKSLIGRSVIVTGGSKGIGRGISRGFGAAGSRVLVVSRSLADAEAVAEEIRAAGGTASGFAADVSTLDGNRAMVDRAVELHGGLDVLCANAGIYPAATIEDMTVDDFDKVMNTNLRSTFLSTAAAVKAMKARGRGRIIITSSTTGPITGYPGWAHYGASKAGQLGFMRTAAIELARYGITVNAVIPGAIMTDGLAELSQEFLGRITAAVPLKRFGTVDEIANGALFLASDEAAYVTGHALSIDGGMTLPEFEMALDESASLT